MQSLRAIPMGGRAVGIVVAVALLIMPIFMPERRDRDARIEPGVFRIENARLNPEFLRLYTGGAISIRNPEQANAVVVQRTLGNTVNVSGGSTITTTMSRPGVFQFFVETGQRSISSFVIVEPVENTQR
jgi:hypothetical protein